MNYAETEWRRRAEEQDRQKDNIQIIDFDQKNTWSRAQVDLSDLSLVMDGGLANVSITYYVLLMSLKRRSVGRSGNPFINSPRSLNNKPTLAIWCYL